MRFLDRLRRGDDPSRVGGPDSVQAADRQILEKLRELGSDLSQPRDVRHYLYFRDEETARRVGEQLTTNGYSVTVDRAAGDDAGLPWLVLANVQMAIDEQVIEAERERFEHLAGAAGEYDGWEAEVSD